MSNLNQQAGDDRPSLPAGPLPVPPAPHFDFGNRAGYLAHLAQLEESECRRIDAAFEALDQAEADALARRLIW